MLSIKAEIRDGSNNNVELRKQGFVPSVFYGPKEKSTPIKISETDFMKVYSDAGESSVINLNDGTQDRESLIHDVQFDPLTGRPLHVDFYIIEKGKKVTVNIPLEFEGVSPAEKTLSGVLIKVMHELEIEAFPKDLPQELIVDISSLIDFESQIHAKDIKLPNGVELLSEPDEVIALVQQKEEEKLDEAPTTIDMENIKVEGKGKEEKEESTEDKK